MLLNHAALGSAALTAAWCWSSVQAASGLGPPQADCTSPCAAPVLGINSVRSFPFPLHLNASAELEHQAERAERGRGRWRESKPLPNKREHKGTK